MQNRETRQAYSAHSPHVTAIVCTRERPEQLEQCLGALSRQTYPDYDVLVVDNAPSQAVQDICRRWSVRWVPAPVAGLTQARNVGARAAYGELIAYIDDDAVAEAGWLQAVAESFLDPDVAAVSGRVRYMNAIGDTRRISDQEAAEDRVRPPGSFNQETPNWFSLACFGGVGDGGNMAFRRELIASSVAFDVRLGRGRVLECGDEHVVFASLIARGLRVIHNPAAIVRHPCPATPVLQKARRLRDLRASIAYVMFLWAEFPAHRGDILRFLRRAMAKRIVPGSGPRPRATRLSRAGVFAAVLGGLLTYWRARREWVVAAAHQHEQSGTALPGFAGPTSGSR